MRTSTCIHDYCGEILAVGSFRASYRYSLVLQHSRLQALNLNRPADFDLALSRSRPTSAAKMRLPKSESSAEPLFHSVDGGAPIERHTAKSVRG